LAILSSKDLRVEEDLHHYYHTRKGIGQNCIKRQAVSEPAIQEGRALGSIMMGFSCDSHFVGQVMGKYGEGWT
jgi:hypothetical protein